MMVEAPNAAARRRRRHAQGQRRNRAAYYGYSAFGGTLGGAPVFAAGEIPIALLPVGGATSGHAASASVVIGLAVTAEATVSPPGGASIDAAASVVIGLTVTASASRTGEGSASVPVAIAPAAEAVVGFVPMRLSGRVLTKPRFGATLTLGGSAT